MSIDSEQSVCDLAIVIEIRVASQKLTVSGCSAESHVDNSNIVDGFSSNQVKEFFDEMAVGVVESIVADIFVWRFYAATAS